MAEDDWKKQLHIKILDELQVKRSEELLENDWTSILVLNKDKPGRRKELMSNIYSLLKQVESLDVHLLEKHSKKMGPIPGNWTDR